MLYANTCNTHAGWTAPVCACSDATINKTKHAPSTKRLVQMPYQTVAVVSPSSFTWHTCVERV